LLGQGTEATTGSAEEMAGEGAALPGSGSVQAAAGNGARAISRERERGTGVGRR
jgi:hypothetical protein